MQIRKPPTPVKQLPSLEATLVYMNRETGKKFIENHLLQEPEKHNNQVIMKNISFKEQLAREKAQKECEEETQRKQLEMQQDLRRRELRAQEIMAEKQRLQWEEEKKRRELKLAEEARERELKLKQMTSVQRMDQKEEPPAAPRKPVEKDTKQSSSVVFELHGNTPYQGSNVKDIKGTKFIRSSINSEVSVTAIQTTKVTENNRGDTRKKTPPKPENANHNAR